MGTVRQGAYQWVKEKSGHGAHGKDDQGGITGLEAIDIRIEIGQVGQNGLEDQIGGEVAKGIPNFLLNGYPIRIRFHINGRL